jgi:hypothetical protein
MDLSAPGESSPQLKRQVTIFDKMESQRRLLIAKQNFIIQDEEWNRLNSQKQCCESEIDVLEQLTRNQIESEEFKYDRAYSKFVKQLIEDSFVGQ